MAIKQPVSPFRTRIIKSLLADKRKTEKLIEILSLFKMQIQDYEEVK